MGKHRVSIDISETAYKAIAKAAIDKGSKVKIEIEKLVEKSVVKK